jgi:hypothetical protein
MGEYKQLVTQLTKLYNTRGKIERKLKSLQEEFSSFEDLETVRKELARRLWQESIERREERKRQRLVEKQQRTEAWLKKKKEEIVFVGRGYSNFLYNHDTDEAKLKNLNLPIVQTAPELANLLDISYQQLRFLAYHREAVSIDHYVRYKVPKRSGGERNIAAPMPILKRAQRAILDNILSKVPVHEAAHGFLAEKSVVTNSNPHKKKPALLINMDLQDFFPSITFERIRGVFKSLGYSGHISTLLAMLCSFSERIPIEVRGVTKHVAVTRRILPQGSPASPMITNIICRRLDNRLEGLCKKFSYTYTRYADDMSFSTNEEIKDSVGKFCGIVNKIVKEEDFEIHLKKTRFLRPNNQQSVTGIVINGDQIGVPKKWVKRVRASLHHFRMMIENKEKLPEGFLTQLSGRISWLHNVNSERYSKMISEFFELLEKVEVKKPSSKRSKKNDSGDFSPKDLPLKPDTRFIKKEESKFIELEGEKYPRKAVDKYKEQGNIPIKNNKFTKPFKEWYNINYKQKKLG